VFRVRLAPQVVDFVRRQAPGPRRRLRQALRDLTAEKGDVKPLEGPLENYCRLRVGTYRVLLHYPSPKTIECLFAERRSIVYEAFAEQVLERLLGSEREEPEDASADSPRR
jgi:mRNA-degrading endonuclease RelE of RelBE toxin-antitoxin system